MLVSHLIVQQFLANQRPENRELLKLCYVDYDSFNQTIVLTSATDELAQLIEILLLDIALPLERSGVTVRLAAPTFQVSSALLEVEL